MPVRKIEIATGKIYHVVNRGFLQNNIFKTPADYSRFIQTLLYYQNINPPKRFSYIGNPARSDFVNYLDTQFEKKEHLVEIVVYCLMPNHFHLILKQLVDSGIQDFMSLVSNSFAKYFNTRYKRKGPLFGGRFRPVLVETNEQLVHVSRYIHLNPYSVGMIKNLANLLEYPYSSLKEYAGKTDYEVCQKESVLEHFKNEKDYLKFVKDNADYQKSLQEIKSFIPQP